MSKLYAKSTWTEQSADYQVLPSQMWPHGWMGEFNSSNSLSVHWVPPCPCQTALPAVPAQVSESFPNRLALRFPLHPSFPSSGIPFLPPSTVPRASERFPPVSHWPLSFSLPSETKLHFQGYNHHCQDDDSHTWLQLLLLSLNFRLTCPCQLTASTHMSQSPHTWNQTHTSYTTEPPKALELGTQVTLGSREVGLNTEDRLRNLSRKKSAPSSIPRRGNYPPPTLQNPRGLLYRELETDKHTHIHTSPSSCVCPSSHNSEKIPQPWNNNRLCKKQPLSENKERTCGNEYW